VLNAIQVKLGSAWSVADKAVKKLQNKQQAERQKQELKQASKLVTSLRELLVVTSEGSSETFRMANPTEEGLNDLMQRARQVVQNQSNPETRLEEASKAMEEARRAAKAFCEEAGRTKAARAKLASIGLTSASIAIVEAGGLIDRLPELRTHGLELLEDVQLPPRAHEQLLCAANQGQLESDLLEPTVPAGYQRPVSKTCGLDYLNLQQPGKNGVFIWSKIIHAPTQRPPLPEPEAVHKPPPDQVSVRDGEQRYVLRSSNGSQVACMLCDT